jgi:hypothetical protein
MIEDVAGAMRLRSLGWPEGQAGRVPLISGAEQRKARYLTWYVVVSGLQMVKTRNSDQVSGKGVTGRGDDITEFVV